MALAITAGATERAEARHGRWVGGAIAGAIIGGAILHHAYRPYRRRSYYYGDPYYYGYSSYYYPRLLSALLLQLLSGLTTTGHTGATITRRVSAIADIGAGRAGT